MYIKIEMTFFLYLENQEQWMKNIISAIVSLETAKCPIFHIYPSPWNHHPAILTIILIFF